jgi:hypothetical protein
VLKTGAKREKKKPNLITSTLSTTDMSTTLQHNDKQTPQSKLRNAHVKLALFVQDGTKDTPNSAKPTKHFLPDRSTHSTQHKTRKEIPKNIQKFPQKNPGTNHAPGDNKLEGSGRRNTIREENPQQSSFSFSERRHRASEEYDSLSSCVREASTTTTRMK